MDGGRLAGRRTACGKVGVGRRALRPADSGGLALDLRAARASSLQESVSRRPRDVYRPLQYSVVTPALNEARNLRRLADSMAVQTVPPREWLIVDHGSVDATGETAGEIARELPFAEAHLSAASRIAPRFAAHRSSRPSRRASAASTPVPRSSSSSTPTSPSSRCSSSSSWRRSRPTTRSASRVGLLRARRRGMAAAARDRRPCPRRDPRLPGRRLDVSPLEQQLGWDGIDELKAELAGWTARTLPDVPFLHHRRVGARDGPRRVGRSRSDGVLHGLPLRLPARPDRIPEPEGADGDRDGVGLPRRRCQAQGTAARRRRPPASPQAAEPHGSAQRAGEALGRSRSA